MNTRGILYILFAMFGLVAGCAADRNKLDDYTPKGLLKAFRLVHNEKLYHGTIDETKMTISIGGIQYGGFVTDVNYQLEDGAEISPNPKELVREWPNEAVFTVKKGDKTVDYKVILSDYISKLPTDVDTEGVIFSTDFNEVDGIPDPAVWALCKKGSSTWNRNMSESYDQAYVENGNLILKAELVDGVYKTGGIESIDKRSFKNARIDIRAKFERSGKGGFPALWLMPQTPIYSGWPDCGEIDIMELLNTDDFIHQTIHSHYKNTLEITDPKPTQTTSYVKDEYNIYSVEYTDEAIRFFVNNEETFTYPNLHLTDEAEKKQWPFSTDFYLILNYALGGEGTWPGPIEDQNLPLTMAVDWVRVKSLEKKSDSQVVMAYMAVDDHVYNTEFNKINWQYITHILPSFCYINADGTFDSEAMEFRIEEIKRTADQYGVKTIASFLSNGKGEFEAAIQTDELREKLANNIIAFVEKYNLDGFDIDYEEYTHLNSNVPNLLELFKKLQTKKSHDMLMTCAINPGKWLNYGKEWHQYFDYINLMSYDALAAGDRPSQHASYEDYVSDIEYCNSEYLMPLTKLVGGLPFYGYSWDDIPGVDKSRGIRFYSIIEHYKDMPEVKNVDQVGNTYYNGRNTIRRKCEYALENKLGGVMVWQLFQDAKTDEDKLLKVVGEVILNK